MNPSTILLIDDNPELLENTSEILEINGFNVICAGDGKNGFHLAKQQLPALVLCDINMDEVDGYGVLHLMKTNLETAGIPFIFFSSRAEARDVRQGMVAGASGYIIKPFTADTLIKTIRSVLTNFQYELPLL